MTERSVFRVFARIIGLLLLAFASGAALAGERTALGYGAIGLALVLGADVLTRLFYRASDHSYLPRDGEYGTDRGAADETTARVPLRKRNLDADAA